MKISQERITKECDGHHFATYSSRKDPRNEATKYTIPMVWLFKRGSKIANNIFSSLIESKWKK